MSPHKHISDAEWALMDAEAREWMNARARPGETKTVIIGPRGAEREVTVRAGFCPCETCGHEYMWECEKADCHCDPCRFTCC